MRISFVSPSRALVTSAASDDERDLLRGCSAEARKKEFLMAAVRSCISDYRGPRTAPLLRGLGWDYGDDGDHGDSGDSSPLLNCLRHAPGSLSHT